MVDMSRDEAQLRFRQSQAKKPEGDGEQALVPWDYKARVKEALERALRDKHITRGVTVAAEKDGPRVVVICTRQANGSWRQQADCQVAWEDGMEPEQLGRVMAEELQENLERVKRGEIPS